MNNIKVVCEKEEGIEYKIRRAAYVIIEQPENKIVIATDGNYFFLGGGLEENEDEIEALRREVIEEAGYTLKNIRFFKKVESYEYHIIRGNLHIIASFYIAEFDKKISDPIEEDHSIIVTNAIDYKDKLYHKYQEYILKEYIKRENTQKTLDVL